MAMTIALDFPLGRPEVRQDQYIEPRLISVSNI